MATDYFIGMSLADKLALLPQLASIVLTGQPTEIQLSRGVKTTFSGANASENYERLINSIMDDEKYDCTDPVMSKIKRSRRAFITRPKFSDY
jgi:hypothetical protein